VAINFCNPKPKP